MQVYPIFDEKNLLDLKFIGAIPRHAKKFDLKSGRAMRRHADFLNGAMQKKSQVHPWTIRLIK